MQITRASSMLTRPFTPPNNKSKVNQLPPARHQRSGFDYFLSKNFLLDVISREKKYKYHYGLQTLNKNKEAVQLFLYFLKLVGFHQKNEKERSTAFQEYLRENRITHLKVKSLQACWNAYAAQLTRDQWSTARCIEEWTAILKRIEALNNTKN
jgi:hypothetical protein